MSDARDALRDKLIEFLEDPKKFMTKNIVLPPFGPKNKVVPSSPSGIFQFSFTKSDKSGNCPIFLIANPDKWNEDKPRFMAYYCHYSTDKMFSMMLGDEMDLMLTPAMNGCSFDVGSETDTATGSSRTPMSAEPPTAPRVSASRKRPQARQIGGAIPDASIIGPADYVGPDFFGTTAGVRRAGHWSFFMQRWQRPTSSSYILDRIIDIA